MSKLDSVQMMTLLSKYQNQIYYYYVDYESLCLGMTSTVTS